MNIVCSNIPAVSERQHTGNMITMSNVVILVSFVILHELQAVVRDYILSVLIH